MRAQHIDQLRAAIAAVEGGWEGRNRPSAPELNGLPIGPGLHEWFGATPPLGIFLYLVRERLGSGCRVLWIGRRCRPYLHALQSARELGCRSIFVDPPDDASRLWAIDLAVRCPATSVVVADGRGLDMAATRRLQLAAEAGSAPVLCARPPEDLKRLSAASTRWQVRCAPSTDKNPRWIVELLRCKGVQPEVCRVPGRARWTLEWKRAKRGVVVHAALVCRPDQPPSQDVPIRRTA